MQPLVDASRIVPGLRLDLRYATEQNFLHRRLYPVGARCLLRERVAQRLARVARALQGQGLFLKVFDCYRPTSVQEEMWKVFPHEGYVANPKKGSIHGRGAAVDLTLVRADGIELQMPTAFDSFLPAAHVDDTSSSKEAQENRARLQEAMKAQGFIPNRNEWWHFSAPEGARYPLSDDPLD
jgi:D-alanyl-D-alanine dipeptidase